MKLSEHGKDMLAAFSFLFDYEFSPEYFTGSVVLTLDEAKQVRIAIAFAMLSTPSLRYGEELSELIETVTERIKQAEMSKQST